jgi:hypothetical protein
VTRLDYEKQRRADSAKPRNEQPLEMVSAPEVSTHQGIEKERPPTKPIIAVLAKGLRATCPVCNRVLQVKKFETHFNKRHANNPLRQQILQQFLSERQSRLPGSHTERTQRSAST